MFWCFPLYVALQILAVFKLRRLWLLAALAPAPFMLYVLWFTVLAFTQQSNLWPIVLLFASPVAFAYMLLVFLLRGVVRHMAGPQSA